jgi:hypothetical protein
MGIKHHQLRLLQNIRQTIGTTSNRIVDDSSLVSDRPAGVVVYQLNRWSDSLGRDGENLPLGRRKVFTVDTAKPNFISSYRTRFQARVLDAELVIRRRDEQTVH